MRANASPENAWQTIHKAIVLGINHVETARGYGKSEEYLGEAMSSDKPLRVYAVDYQYLVLKFTSPPKSHPHQMLTRCVGTSMNL
jgi:predicted aldo/keto reductase-like oxidoreductase